MVADIITTESDTSLLRLMQLVSPALPVGAYAYSQGLEYATNQGWIRTAADTQNWILGLLHSTHTHTDIAVFVRLYHAWQQDDEPSVHYWNAILFASRESAELQLEEQHLGRALAKLLTDLNLTQAHPWCTSQRCCFATLFSLAAYHWGISMQQAATGYTWTWVENQVAAATKLVPLGQTASQRMLAAIIPEITQAVAQGSQLGDEAIGCAAPGLIMASMFHETQYSRLFRS